MELVETVTLTFFGGIFPALVWLYYWLKEDSHPEPKRLIFLTFLLGMLCVPAAILFQWFINIAVVGYGLADPTTLFFSSYPIAMTLLILWSTIEEVLKYLAAHFGGISRKENNEPIDPIIYMITAALGFSALENSLYILKEIGDNSIILNNLILVGNFRFIGSTLLHTASSAIIGLFAAFSYYQNERVKISHLFAGLVCAVTLHTLFNSFIIRQEVYTLIGFSIVWLSIVTIILLFEKVKVIKQGKQNL